MDSIHDTREDTLLKLRERIKRDYPGIAKDVWVQIAYRRPAENGRDYALYILDECFSVRTADEVMELVKEYRDGLKQSKPVRFRESKTQIVKKLFQTLKFTRQGSDVRKLTYRADDYGNEFVDICYYEDRTVTIDVTACSGISIINSIITKIA